MSLAPQEDPSWYPLDHESVQPNISIVPPCEQVQTLPAPEVDAESRHAKVSRVIAQSIVRITHVLDAVVVGPSVYMSGIERSRRNKERTAVGLKPKQ